MIVILLSSYFLKKIYLILEYLIIDINDNANIFIKSVFYNKLP